MKNVNLKIKRSLISPFVTMVLITFIFILSASGNMDEGKKVYDRYCMECHHTDGMGILAPPFVESSRFKSKEGVVALIDYIMPATSPDLITGTQAEDVAEYVVTEFKFELPKESVDQAGISDETFRKVLFDQTCSVCHGVDGKGDLARPIAASSLFKTKKDAVSFINGLMPFHNPKKCQDECAENTGEYIIDNFDLKMNE
jgi:mono/diheme cytochrome c family protein